MHGFVLVATSGSCRDLLSAATLTCMQWSPIHLFVNPPALVAQVARLSGALATMAESTKIVVDVVSCLVCVWCLPVT